MIENEIKNELSEETRQETKTYTYNEIRDNIDDPRLKKRLKSKKSKIENTSIYAGFWIRMIAYIFDALLVLGIINITKYYTNIKMPVSNKMLFVITFSIYCFLSVIATKGYTAGKYILGIKVVSNKEELNTSTIVIRELFGKIILATYKIIFVLVPFSSKKHSIVDYFTDTSVIKVKYEEEFNNIKVLSEQ